MTSLTRGPLPARVYWTRRLLVLGTALLLVLGVGRLLTGGSDASSTASVQVVQAGAPAATGPALTEPTETRTAKQKPGQKKTKKTPVLAQPEGTCLDSDIAVTPSLADPVAGRTVLVVLELRTISSPACTWRVSPDTLTVKITSGQDDIWASQQCPRAVPTRSVVVRSAVSTKVGVRWSGRRSDDGCTRLTDWALPGWYHVAAAALAGEPSDLQFQLSRPSRQVITRAPEPEESGKGKGKKRRDTHAAGGGQGQSQDEDLKHR